MMDSREVRALIDQCHAALAEELAAWDIDPPLHHVKEAHDACEAWLATHPKPASPIEAGQEVSDEITVLALMRKFNELPSWDRGYAAALETDIRAILALRSGASAQPAEGGAAISDRKLSKLIGKNYRMLDAQRPPSTYTMTRDDLRALIAAAQTIGGAVHG